MIGWVVTLATQKFEHLVCDSNAFCVSRVASEFGERRQQFAHHVSRDQIVGLMIREIIEGRSQAVTLRDLESPGQFGGDE